MVNQELIDFIKKSKETGQTDEQIKSTLLAKGWQESDIYEVLTMETSHVNSEKRPKKRVLLFSIIVAAMIIFGIAVAFYFLYPKFAKDALAETFEKMSGVNFYTQEITFESQENNQKIKIEGTFDTNIKEGKTKGHLDSIYQTNGTDMKISSDYIIIGPTIYAKLSIENLPLKDTFPNGWFRLDSTNLPKEINREFINDNLAALLKDGKKFITVQKKKEEVLDNQKLLHYTLAIEPTFFENSNLTENQKSFFIDVAKGNIEVWINENSFLMEKVVFDGPNTKLTNIIKNVNNPISIEAPAFSISLEEFKLKQFESILSKTPVNEVFIGYYGKIPQETIERIKNIIEEKFSIKTTILLPPEKGGEFPKATPFYDSNRKQFDADYIWQSLIYLSKQYGQNVRLLFVVDVDLFTNIQKERPYIFSRALPDTNTAIISIYRLKNLSDQTNNQAPLDLFYSRLEKLVTRTLGVTVGLSLSPNSSDISCVMYQFKDLSALDKTGNDFCGYEKDALKKVFINN